MSETAPGIALAAAVGLAAGAFFFGGLRLTVNLLVTARRPALLAMTSLVVRTAVVLASFYWVGHGQWHRYVAALVGFVVARIVLVRLLGVGACTVADK